MKRKYIGKVTFLVGSQIVHGYIDEFRFEGEHVLWIRGWLTKTSPDVHALYAAAAML